jgi:hypothetical protein
MHVVELEEVKRRLFEKFGNDIILLDFVKMNENSKFLCNKHNMEFYTRPGQLITRGSGCPSCVTERRSEVKIFSYEYVENYINSTDCKLISENYYGVDDKLLISFPCGHTKELSFYNFKKGSRCPDCGRKIGGTSKRLGEEKVKNRLKEKGLEVIEFIDGYSSTSSMIKTKCENGHIETHSISSLLYSCKCNQCTIERMSLEKRGSKGSNWQGGKSTIIGFLHKQLREWKKASLDASHHKCLICQNTKGLHIHHIYNFTNILNDAFRKLNLKRKLFIFEYTSEEIDLLTEKVKELHSQHFLGVALCKYHHQEFHFWYGRYNNSLSQLEDFIEYCKEENGPIWSNNKPT